MSFDEREITDPTWMRAMAHPLRWQILDVLRASDEPLTATQVSDQIGESPANCSFHLRTLAKYGFIEEAGGGKGRSRPWRARDVQIEVRQVSEGEAPEAAQALRAVIRERAFRAIETWERGSDHTYPQQWHDAAMSAEWDVKLTLEDLAQIQEEIMAILERYTSREKAPENAVRAKVLAWAFPLGPPPDTAPTTPPRPKRDFLRSSSPRRSDTEQDRK